MLLWPKYIWVHLTSCRFRLKSATNLAEEQNLTDTTMFDSEVAVRACRIAGLGTHQSPLNICLADNLHSRVWLIRWKETAGNDIIRCLLSIPFPFLIRCIFVLFAGRLEVICFRSNAAKYYDYFGVKSKMASVWISWSTCGISRKCLNAGNLDHLSKVMAAGIADQPCSSSPWVIFNIQQRSRRNDSLWGFYCWEEEILSRQNVGTESGQAVQDVATHVVGETPTTRIQPTSPQISKLRYIKSRILCPRHILISHRENK